MAELVVGGRAYGGWKSLEISRSLANPAGAFSFTASERWPGQVDGRPLRAGQDARVEIEGAVVCQGWLTTVEVTLDARTHEVRVAGRDLTARLIDCSHLGALQWKSRTLAQIAEAMCRPFGIRVSVAPGLALNRIEKVVHQLGAPPWETLEREARTEGVLFVADGRGGLMLSRPGLGPKVGTILEGAQPLALRAHFSHEGRHSVYEARAEEPAQALPIEGAQRSYTAAQRRDPAIPGYQPTLILAEGRRTIRQLQARADWEMNVRVARGTRISLTAQGWTSPAGSLWAPGDRLHLRAASINIDDELLVEGVRLSLSDGGTTAELTLIPPDAYLPEPRQGGAAW